jgi:hypothetical protein
MALVEGKTCRIRKNETGFRKRAGVLTVGMSAAVLAFGACSSTSRPRSAAGPRVVTLTYSDGGRSIEVHDGDSVKVILSSTYWSFQDSSNPNVLRSGGSAKVVPQLSGCVPGQGCGTVTATFKAIGVGTATIVATRTVCGEALRCNRTNDHYQVAVSVS